MIKYRIPYIIVFLAIITLFLNGCNGKLPGGDARKFPDDPAKRVEQNLKEVNYYLDMIRKVTDE